KTRRDRGVYSGKGLVLTAMSSAQLLTASRACASRAWTCLQKAISPMESSVRSTFSSTGCSLDRMDRPNLNSRQCKAILQALGGPDDERRPVVPPPVTSHPRTPTGVFSPHRAPQKDHHPPSSRLANCHAAKLRESLQQQNAGSRPHSA